MAESSLQLYVIAEPVSLLHFLYIWRTDPRNTALGRNINVFSYTMTVQKYKVFQLCDSNNMPVDSVSTSQTL